MILLFSKTQHHYNSLEENKAEKKKISYFPQRINGKDKDTGKYLSKLELICLPI